MAGLATQETNKPISGVLDALSDSQRKDCLTLITLMESITGFSPKIWGNYFIIGFGKYRYQRKNKKDVYEWFHVGFAPRRDKITIYLTLDLTKETETLKQLGTCSWGKGCLYIPSLSKKKTIIQ